MNARLTRALALVALLPLAAALVCLGGCPMCWIVGLIETILRRKSRAACDLP